MTQNDSDAISTNEYLVDTPLTLFKNINITDYLLQLYAHYTSFSQQQKKVQLEKYLKHKWKN